MPMDVPNQRGIAIVGGIVDGHCRRIYPSERERCRDAGRYSMDECQRNACPVGRNVTCRLSRTAVAIITHFFYLRYHIIVLEDEK